MHSAPVELAASESAPGKEDNLLRLFAVLRTDLVMSAGKAAAQAGHAFLGALSAANGTSFSDDAAAYLQEAPGTKVVLGGSLIDIERLADRLSRAGIPSFLVVDEGHIAPPDFDGSPIVTALGIAPLRRSLSRRHLARFKPYGG